MIEDNFHAKAWLLGISSRSGLSIIYRGASVRTERRRKKKKIIIRVITWTVSP